jgi:hypothetical protein
MLALAFAPMFSGCIVTPLVTERIEQNGWIGYEFRSYEEAIPALPARGAYTGVVSRPDGRYDRYQFAGVLVGSRRLLELLIPRSNSGEAILTDTTEKRRPIRTACLWVWVTVAEADFRGTGLCMTWSTVPEMWHQLLDRYEKAEFAEPDDNNVIFLDVHHAGASVRHRAPIYSRGRDWAAFDVQVDLGWVGRSRIENGLWHTLYVVSVPADIVLIPVCVVIVGVPALFGVWLGH